MLIDVLQKEELSIFLISAALVFGFLLLEIILMALGLSSFSESPDMDAPMDLVDVELAGMPAAEIAAELEIAPEIAADIESALSEGSFAPSQDGPAGISNSGSSGNTMMGTFLDMLGFKNLPFSASLALFCAGFASAGLAVQFLVYGLLGFMIPVALMAPVAFVAAAVFTKNLSSLISGIIPKEETSAISERSLGRRRGVVTVGTASAGRPAEVKVFDGYSNQHYLMVEPLSADDRIPEGSEVVVLRVRDGSYRIVKIS